MKMYLIAGLVVFVTTLRLSHQFVFPDMAGRDMLAKEAGRDILITRNGKDITTQKTDSYKDTEKNNLIKEKDDSSLNLIDDKSFCRNGTEFCTDPISYPIQAIRKALRKQKRIINSMFDTDLFRLRLRSGIDLFHGGENVCDMSTTHIKPKAARNKKGEFKFLVNGGEGGEDYIQLVKISQCLGVGESCGKGKVFTREVTECRQEYADHKLVALDEKGKELIVDTFSFPSCCSCFMQTGLEL
jgi:hypothetical protein